MFTFRLSYRHLLLSTVGSATRAASQVAMKLMPASLEESIQTMRERRVVTRTFVAVRKRSGVLGPDRCRKRPI